MSHSGRRAEAIRFRADAMARGAPIGRRCPTCGFLQCADNQRHVDRCGAIGRPSRASVDSRRHAIARGVDVGTRPRGVAGVRLRGARCCTRSRCRSGASSASHRDRLIYAGNSFPHLARERLSRACASDPCLTPRRPAGGSFRHSTSPAKPDRVLRRITICAPPGA